jgi:hypothetical protein
LQNFTCPAVSGTPPEVTVAVIVMIEPAVVLVGEAARVVVVLLAAKPGWQLRRMLPINIAKSAGNRNRLVMVCCLSFS